MCAVDEQFAQRGNPECTERVTERFIEASGAAGKNDWLDAWSEVVDAGDTGETDQMMLVFVHGPAAHRHCLCV